MPSGLGNRIRMAVWDTDGKEWKERDTLPYLSILSWAWQRQVGRVTGVATGCHCQQVATTLSAHNNPLHFNSFSRKRLPMSCQPPLILSILSSSLWRRPPGLCLGHLLAPGIDLNCHPGPASTPVHGPIYCGSWVQMIFLPSPAPVFLVSWLLMTTLERAEWRFHKQFAPWICKSNIWRCSNTSLSYWYELK